jgi:hypothetical protein
MHAFRGANAVVGAALNPVFSGCSDHRGRSCSKLEYELMCAPSVNFCQVKVESLT